MAVVGGSPFVLAAETSVIIAANASVLLATIAALASQLGDPYLLLTLLVALTVYDRERGLPVLAVTVGAFGLALVAETLLAVPARSTPPPVPAESLPSLVRPVYELATAKDGYALPSGSVVGATVVWPQLAWTGSVATRRVRLVTALAVAALVAWSRVFLGAHQPVDVLAGVALGAGWLLVVSGVKRGVGRN